MSGTGNGIREREMGFGNGKWDLGAGIWERGEVKRAKIERKARREAERPNKDNCQLTTDNRCFFELKVCDQCSEFRVQSSAF